MRHCRLLLHTLILGCILGKQCSAVRSNGGDLASQSPSARRTILQSSNASIEALLEDDPAFDAAVELQALTALYEATGGRYWTYDSYFSGNSSDVSSGSSAIDALARRFHKRTWLDTSVSYCQW